MLRYSFVVLIGVVGCSQGSEPMGNPFARDNSSPLCSDGESSCQDGNVHRCAGESWVLEVPCASQNLACVEASGVARCAAPGGDSLDVGGEQEEGGGLECTDGQSRCVSDSIESCNAGAWALIADCGGLGQRCAEEDSGAFCQTVDGPEVPVSGLCVLSTEFWNQPHRDYVLRYRVRNPQDVENSPLSYAERKDASTLGLSQRAWLDYDEEDRLLSVAIDDNGDGSIDRHESQVYDAEGKMNELKQFIGNTQVGRFWVEQDGNTQTTRYDEGLDGDLEYFEERQYNAAGLIARRTVDGTLKEDRSMPPSQSFVSAAADGTLGIEYFKYDNEQRWIERRIDVGGDNVDDYLITRSFSVDGSVTDIDNGADGTVEQRTTFSEGPLEERTRMEFFAPQTSDPIFAYEYVEKRDAEGAVYEQELRSQPEIFSSNEPAALLNQVFKLPEGGSRVDGYSGSSPDAPHDQLVRDYELRQRKEEDLIVLEVDSDFDGVSDLRIVEELNEAGLLSFREVDGLFKFGPDLSGIQFGLRYDIIEGMDGQWNYRYHHDFSCLSF